MRRLWRGWGEWISSRKAADGAKRTGSIQCSVGQYSVIDSPPPEN